MKFVVLSHAGLLVEHHGIRLVCDPWLIGSCYWRSWWNFPEPDPQLIENLEPQFIYLTHLHWDHFHGPSLRKLFDPKTRIIVPKVPTRRMLDDLKWLGFHNVTEVPHGGTVRLGDDFELRSYQFGLGVDSAAVISGGGRVLFNCNDCKLFGWPLRQVLRNHPRIDFMFRSHSSASPVPHCVEGHEALLPPDDGRYDSADQFARCALYAKARYAIPFASNHCFLHEETRQFNATATTPDLAMRRYAALAAASIAPTECVVMPPGSSWSETDGFAIQPFDFAGRDDYVEGMLTRNSEKLEANAAVEAATVADWAAFQHYFSEFLAAIPWFIKRWRLSPMCFRVADSTGMHCWNVDPGRGIAAEIASPSDDSVVLTVHAAVLNDCANHRMFSVWTASKRLRIRLPSAAALSQVNLWFTLFDLFETDLLPLRKNLSPRSLGVRIRRWREPLEVANILFRRVAFREKFSVARIYPLGAVEPGGGGPGGAAVEKTTLGRRT
jgi:UDP-MurNAc hydroxylase